MSAPEPWTADIPFDLELGRALIAEQFPDLAGASVEPYGEGWDNVALLVRAEGDPARPWIFRFPRRRAWAYNLGVESAVLPAIAGGLPLAVPVPERVGRPGERFPWTFVGYRYLPGTPAVRRELDDDGRLALAASLGRFLARLHGIDGPRATALGAPPDEHDRLELQDRDGRARAALARSEERGLFDGEEVARARALLDEADLTWEPAPIALVHGDLDLRHVLVDADDRPCGVIDWGDVHRGDPAVDLGGVLGYLGPEGVERLRAAYGPVDEARWRGARAIAVITAVLGVEYARGQDDPDFEREERAALRRLAAW